MKDKRNLVELFGHAPYDTARDTRRLWNLGACPFIEKACNKINHDQTIVYGTCSVTSPYGDIIICPNRLYANNYESLRKVSKDAFGEKIPFLLYDDFIKNGNKYDECIVALGQNSGKEVKVGNSLSMDWVLAYISNSELIEYTGIEVQSIDITGNYRDCWHFFKNFKSGSDITNAPSSQHGLNWANVHKRLIPQLIRKGVVYSRSKYVKNGLYFILPEIVYKKFEDIIGSDIPLLEKTTSETITVHTYELGKTVNNNIRDIVEVRKIRFSLDEFSQRFISGPNLPSGEELDNAVLKILGLT